MENQPCAAAAAPARAEKKSSPNKATRARQERAAVGGLMPVDYLLSVMRNRQMPASARIEAAVKVAPYLHPKLAAVDPSAAKPPEIVEKLAEARAQQMISELLASIDGAGTGLPSVKVGSSSRRIEQS